MSYAEIKRVVRGGWEDDSGMLRMEKRRQIGKVAEIFQPFIFAKHIKRYWDGQGAAMGIQSSRLIPIRVALVRRK